MDFRARLLIALLFLVYGCPWSIAQPPAKPAHDAACAMPLTGLTSERNLFNEQQEEWLGEVLDTSLRKSYHVIDDPAGRLQQIGERLLAQLPPTAVHYRFVIVDSPGLNSFGLAGGRIYIYRRMIAFARNEDQLAALLGHEIGHMIAHQSAIDVSRWFLAMGIEHVTDKQDISSKWNQFLDNSSKIQERGPAHHGNQEQLVADRICLYAMVRAGYDPAQLVEFMDRTFETKGKTGNFWTDLFGNTSAESKRLREMMHSMSSVPRSCIAEHPDPSAFIAWQRSIVEAKRTAGNEQLPGLVSKVSLKQALRSDLDNVQFSPDGKYLLAQDDSSIFLLSRVPLANLFRIDAPEAERAQFTPDSKSVVFYDPEMRVQKWDIESQGPVFVRALPETCARTALSPTGEVMACLKDDRDLLLLDLKSGNTVFEKKKFFELSRGEQLMAEIMSEFGLRFNPVEFLTSSLHFSLDGQTFLASHGDYSVAYDLQKQAPIKVPGKVQAFIKGNFAFVGPDEIFGSDEARQHVARVRLSTGEVLDRFPFVGGARFYPAPNTHYVMVRPSGMAPIGAIDLGEKKVTMGYKTPGFALYDKLFAGEDVDGMLKLYDFSTKSTAGQVQLPTSPISTSRVLAFSGDGKWLAASGRTRGGVWRLADGDRLVYGPDFEGAFFSSDGKLLAKFPKLKQDPQRVVEFDPATLATTKLYDLQSGEDGPGASDPRQLPKAQFIQQADLLMRLGPAANGKKGKLEMEVRDLRTQTVLWQLPLGREPMHFRYLPDANTITFVVGRYDTIKEAAKKDPALAAQLDAIKGGRGKEDSYLLEVYESRSHKRIGALLVDTGNLSFKVNSAVTVGDNVFAADSENRTLIYSLQSGKQIGKVFGNAVAFSPSGSKFLVENEQGVADLYDSTSLRAINHFNFPAKVAHAEFRGEENVLVLTADQTVYSLDLKQPETRSAATSATPN